MTEHSCPSSPHSKPCFTITAEIHERSLANFYGQYADRHMNLKFMRRISEREPAIRQFVIVKNKLNVLGHPGWGILANFEHKCWPQDREV